MTTRSDMDMAEQERRLGLVTARPQLRREEVVRRDVEVFRSADVCGIRLFGKDVSLRIILGAVAAAVLLCFSPWHLRIALVGVAVCVFQSVLTELLFARVDRKQTVAAGSVVRGARQRRHRFNWLFLLLICEGIPLTVVCLLLWLFFK